MEARKCNVSVFHSFLKTAAPRAFGPLQCKEGKALADEIWQGKKRKN
jgi:hypothetical protein